jgi:hypothetical protein
MHQLTYKEQVTMIFDVKFESYGAPSSPDALGELRSNVQMRFAMEGWRLTGMTSTHDGRILMSFERPRQADAGTDPVG